MKIEIFKGTKAEGAAFDKLGATVTNHAFATKVTEDLERDNTSRSRASRALSANPTGVTKEVR